jgi:hypothetical protein
MRQAEMVETGRATAEVRLRLGVVCGALAVVVYALTQALSLPLLPTLLLVCAFGPLLAIGSAGLWELLRRHRRTATLDIGLVANLAAGITVTLMLLAQLGLKAWFNTGLGGSAQQVSPEVAQVAFQAGNGLQLGLDMAWDVFLAIGTAMLAWNMAQHPRFGPAYAATGLLLAVALIGFNLAAFLENPAGPAWWMWGRWSAPGTCGSLCGWRPRWVGPRTIAEHRQGTKPSAVAAAAKGRGMRPENSAGRSLRRSAAIRRLLEGRTHVLAVDQVPAPQCLEGGRGDTGRTRQRSVG